MVPKLFGTRDQFRRRHFFFLQTKGRSDGFEMIQAHDIYCALYFYYYDMSSTIDQFSSVQTLSRVWLFATPWTTARQAFLFITNSRNPPKPMSIESVMPSNYLIILCSPFSSCPQSFPTSGSFQVSQLLTSGGQSIRVSASKSVLPNEHPGLISFSMDWLDLLEHHRRSLGIKTQRLGSPDVNISC